MKGSVFMHGMARSAVFTAAVLCCAIVPKAQTVPTGFNNSLVMGGWSEPVGFTFDANGRWYVWERGGRVWIVENGVKLNPPLIDLSAEVGGWRDHGLLGFTLDPNFLSNGRIYLMYAVDRHHLMNFGTQNYNANTTSIMRSPSCASRATRR